MNWTVEQGTLVSDSGVERSGGTHLTDVVKSLLRDLKIQDYGDGYDEARELMFESGFAWERLLNDHYWREGSQGFVPLGEVVLDGIACSPDGMWWRPDIDAWSVHESKFTWRSSKKLPHENEYWKMQGLAYCRVLDLVHIEWHVLHVNGDYGPPRPDYRIYRYEFAPIEIERNWVMLVKHARQKGMVE